MLIIAMMMYEDWLKKHWKSKNYEATPHAKSNSFLENEDSKAVNPFQFYSFVHYSFVGKSRDICQANDIYKQLLFSFLAHSKVSKRSFTNNKKANMPYANNISQSKAGTDKCHGGGDWTFNSAFFQISRGKQELLDANSASEGSS